jgi:group I intron endonuclease
MYSLYHIGIDADLSTGYIGISRSPELRFSQHQWQRKESNQHLKNAMQKYGKDVFKRVVFCNLDKEAAALLEEMLRPEPNIGWNITKGGGIPPSPKGKTRSAEYRANISKAKMGANNPMYGKKIVMSDEHKAKLSLSAKSMPLITCPHCGYTGSCNGMKRWHFDRCKNVRS